MPNVNQIQPMLQKKKALMGKSRRHLRCFPCAYKMCQVFVLRLVGSKIFTQTLAAKSTLQARVDSLWLCRNISQNTRQERTYWYTWMPCILSEVATQNQSSLRCWIWKDLAEAFLISLQLRCINEREIKKQTCYHCYLKFIQNKSSKPYKYKEYGTQV